MIIDVKINELEESFGKLAKMLPIFWPSPKSVKYIVATLSVFIVFYQKANKLFYITL